MEPHLSGPCKESPSMCVIIFIINTLINAFIIIYAVSLSDLYQSDDNDCHDLDTINELQSMITDNKIEWNECMDEQAIVDLTKLFEGTLRFLHRLKTNYDAAKSYTIKKHIKNHNFLSDAIMCIIKNVTHTSHEDVKKMLACIGYALFTICELEYYNSFYYIQYQLLPHCCDLIDDLNKYEMEKCRTIEELSLQHPLTKPFDCPICEFRSQDDTGLQQHYADRHQHAFDIVCQMNTDMAKDWRVIRKDATQLLQHTSLIEGNPNDWMHSAQICLDSIQRYRKKYNNLNDELKDQAEEITEQINDWINELNPNKQIMDDCKSAYKEQFKDIPYEGKKPLPPIQRIPLRFYRGDQSLWEDNVIEGIFQLTPDSDERKFEDSPIKVNDLKDMQQMPLILCKGGKVVHEVKEFIVELGEWLEVIDQNMLDMSQKTHEEVYHIIAAGFCMDGRKKQPPILEAGDRAFLLDFAPFVKQQSMTQMEDQICFINLMPFLSRDLRLQSCAFKLQETKIVSLLHEVFGDETETKVDFDLIDFGIIEIANGYQQSGIVHCFDAPANKTGVKYIIS